METTEEPESTEERIFIAAEMVLLEKGSDRARMQDIAEAAGVNHALVHYYFRSKSALVKKVLERSIGRMMPRVFAMVKTELPLEEKVHRFVSEYTDLLVENPNLARFIISEAEQHPERIQHLIEEIGRPQLDILERQIQQQVEAGRMQAIPVEQFLVNLVSLCVFPFLARPMMKIMVGVDEEDFPAFVEERKEIIPAVFLNGLRGERKE